MIKCSDDYIATYNVVCTYMQVSYKITNAENWCIVISTRKIICCIVVVQILDNKKNGELDS